MSIAISQRLRVHIDELACAIGERNVSQPAALRAAAEYIGNEWQAQGYEVIPQVYRAALSR